MLSIIIPSKKEVDLGNMLRSTKALYPDAEIIVIEDNTGHGKGWAIREGLKKVTGDIVVFIDGDIDIHPGEIQNLLIFLDYYDVVVGIKDTRTLPPKRRLVSFGYRVLIRFLFKLHISDTQTGLKVWKRDKVPTFETDGFAYDIELMTKARKANLRIKEVPIRCRIYAKVALSSIVKTFWETMRIWLGR